MFDPKSISTFRFTGSSFDPASGRLSLGYALDDRYAFTERYTFPGVSRSLSPAETSVLERLVRLLHLAAGVSYFKTSVPPNIEIEGPGLSPGTAGFFNKLYVNGLGEFAFKNSLFLRGRVNFPVDLRSADSEPVELEKKTNGFLIPLGGGKDSLVTFEIVKRLGRPLATYILGDFPAIREVASSLHVPCFVAGRTIDPLLLRLNQEGAYNGHVPISSIFSLSALIVGVLHGFPTVLASQERSANSGNILHDGMEVNHQYSKSLEFERDFSELLQGEVSPGVRHFSLLRSFSEVHIAKLFARFPAYHQIFTSCNASFRLSSERKKIWCGKCPKCRFVFLILAPFLPKDRVLQIFGKNLLADTEQLVGYLDLLGLGEMKPFECVGEFDEARWSLAALAGSDDWKNEIVVKALLNRIPDVWDTSLLTNEIFSLSPEHCLPAELERAVHEFARA